MRIVAGALRGRSLAGPAAAGRAIRPTSDRLRGAIFNILAHGGEDAVSGARVLDLFAGTGAMGLEALSRGARFCLFVEAGAEGRALIRRNIEALELTGVTRLFRRDATRLGAAGNMGRFRLVFVDPPYGRGLAQRALVSARDGGWLEAGATVVVEETREARFAPPDGFRETGRRTHGDSEVTFLVFAP